VVVAEDPACLDTAYGTESLGPWEGRLDNDRDEVVLRRPDGQVEDRVAYRLGFPWPTDTQGRSIELIHPELDNDLGGSWRAARLDASATPGRENSVWSIEAPPQIRQVDHDPQEPTAGQFITVTAKVTDPEALASVQLLYQTVIPGHYLPARLPLTSEELRADGTQTPAVNPAFIDPANWQSMAMVDDGTQGDREAGDDTYTATLPAQSHRTLVRYRIRATDTQAQTVTVPYPDDAGLNFACWVYDGVPPYYADTHSVLGSPYAHDPAHTASIPTYHLLTRAEDLRQCLAYSENDQIADPNHPGRRAYNWEGALVYEGKVYDHIPYRLRESEGRYHLQGKRNMTFRFPRGHGFAARDHWGQAYPVPWQNLHVSKCFDSTSGTEDSAEGNFGLLEVVHSILYNLMGIPTRYAHWFQLRVVDDAEEAPDQYHGDFWGLFVALEAYDDTFIKQHALPEGNLYGFRPGDTGPLAQQRYQGRDSVTDGSDILRVRNELNPDRSAAELNELLNVDRVFRYLAVNTALGDAGTGTGYADRYALHFFHPQGPANPLGQLWYLPGDTMGSWRLDNHPGCYESWWALGGDCLLPTEDVTGQVDMRRAFRNTLREFRDLLWNRDVIDPLLEELAAHIESATYADRDRWTDVPDWAQDAGAHNRFTGSVWDTVEKMKAFAWAGSDTESGHGMNALLDAIAGQEGDAASIPATPTLDYIGPEGYPIDRLTFAASRFSDPQGDHTFAAMRWRLADVSDATPPRYEIESIWESEDRTSYAEVATLPGQDLTPGHRYRARVRMQDDSARWSHWSDPVEFLVGLPADTRLRDSLRITEIMYHPADPPLRHPDAEFIEIANMGPDLLSLAGVRIDNALAYTFGQEDLYPGQHVLLVQNRAVFEAIYGTGLPIVGEYLGRLDNDGDTLEVYDIYGQKLHDISYQDNWHPLTDGQGFSLVPYPAAGDPVDKSVASAWQPSHRMGGSPGWPESADVPDAGSILINEILAHSHDADPDWVELVNTTDQALYIGGWFLSDSLDERTKYEIAAGTTIPPHGYVVFYEDLHFGNPLNPGTHSAFALSDDGEILYLTSGFQGEPTSYQEQEAFGASDTGISFGRWKKSTGGVNFVPLAYITRGAENAPPLVGPVVINEIMYNPDGDSDAEYVEILNISQEPVYLYDSLVQESWRFTDDPDNPSIDLTWEGSQDVVLSPGQTALLVKDLSALLGQFSIAPGTMVFTWPDGGLSNAGEKLELSKAGELENGQRYWIRVDRVVYADESPWPKQADGDGSALQRLDAQAYGNDPINWQAAPASPGIP
jgi:hypothetical protein